MLDRTFILYKAWDVSQLWNFLKQYAKACAEAGKPLAVTITEWVPSKTREQEKKYHAMIGDIAEQCNFLGEKHSDDDWKRLLIDGFAKYKKAMGEPLPGYGRVLPSLDGQGIVQLGAQSRRFNIKQGAEFIEFLYAFGAEPDRNVMWSEPANKQIN